MMSLFAFRSSADQLFHPISLLTRVLDFVLPCRCLLCGHEMGRNGDVCQDCWQRLNFIRPPYCQKCGLPFDVSEAENASLSDREDWEAALCERCEFEPPPFDRLRSAIRYDVFSRKLILDMKHHDHLEGAEMFAHWMYIAATKMVRDADIIIPAPIHRRRLFKRGFNQAAILAKKLGRMGGRPVHVDLIEKTQATPSQVGLDFDARLANITPERFKIHPKSTPMIENRRVIVVDDVYTTGATSHALTSVLRNAGASQIDILTLARVAHGLENAI